MSQRSEQTPAPPATGAAGAPTGPIHAIHWPVGFEAEEAKVVDVARRLNRWAARRVREIIPLCSGSFLDVSDSLVVRDEGGIRGLLPIHLAVRTVDQLFGEPRILDWLPKYMPRRDEYEHSKDHYWEAREHYGRDVVLSSYLVRFGWRMTLWADRLPAQPSDAELERVDRLRGLLRSEVAWTATELVRIAVNSGWMSVLGDEWVAHTGCSERRRNWS